MVSAVITPSVWVRRVTSVLAWVVALCYIHRTPASLFGMDTMLAAARAMAATAEQVLSDGELRAAAQREFSAAQ